VIAVALILAVHVWPAAQSGGALSGVVKHSCGAPLAAKAGAQRATLQFRAQFFKIFNIVTFGLPSNVAAGPGFGEITKTAGNSRQIQFSLKPMY
jgi:hypothetical protein